MIQVIFNSLIDNCRIILQSLILVATKEQIADIESFIKYLQKLIGDRKCNL